jgi:hypothetical protein
MSHQLMREITPLTQNDCFMLFSRVKKEFNFPIHCHEEFELNLILNAAGAQRVVGDHLETIGAVELVLVGPNLPHAWFTHECRSGDIREMTIQFHKDLLDERFLRRNQLHFIQKMFENAQRGILFAPDTAERLQGRILGLEHKMGFDSVLELFSILHDLSAALQQPPHREGIRIPQRPLQPPDYPSRGSQNRQHARGVVQPLHQKAHGQHLHRQPQRNPAGPRLAHAHRHHPQHCGGSLQVRLQQHLQLQPHFQEAEELHAQAVSAELLGHAGVYLGLL